jgi:hypothetical protein
MGREKLLVVPGMGLLNWKASHVFVNAMSGALSYA